MMPVAMYNIVVSVLLTRGSVMFIVVYYTRPAYCANVHTELTHMCALRS